MEKISIVLRRRKIDLLLGRKMERDRNQMNIIIYEGRQPINKELGSLMKQAISMYQGVELQLRVCQTEEQLLQAVRGLSAEEAERREDIFPFRTCDGVHFLKLAQIVYFKCRAHVISAFLADGRELTGIQQRQSMRDLMAPLLMGGQFLQLSRSYVVNKEYIRYLGKRSISVDIGTALPVSRQSYPRIKAILLENECGSE